MFRSSSVGMLLFVMAILPLQGQSRHITADWSDVAGVHPTSPLLVVGAGRANEGLRAAWQQQLAIVQHEIGFGYVRMHGLLNDDMGVYSETRDGAPVYNFQYIDSLYDAMLALHVRPFVELGFMPSALASGKQTIFWWNGNVTPPKDAKKWSALIEALIRHWKERYGESEIQQWYFEVWNEPDLSGFFTGSLDEYLALYRNTAETIKHNCSVCRVGGPASAQPYRYEQALVAFCSQNHIPIDFVSTHAYGVEQGFLDATGSVGTRLSANPHVVSDRMRHSRQLIDASALPKLELHFSEWSSAYTQTDRMHDQYHQAPFILEQIRQAASAVQSMSYWTFTDIFEEGGPPKTPFHGGFGLMNYEGIRKPAFYAYHYLSQLGTTDLKVTDEHSWITKSESGQVAAIFWDYTPMLPPSGENDQSFYGHELKPRELAPATLTLNHLPAGRYSIAVYLTGYGHNDPYDVYLKMGAPSQITKEQVTMLNLETAGMPIREEDIIVGAGGGYSDKFALRTNDVYLVLLTPIR